MPARCFIPFLNYLSNLLLHSGSLYFEYFHAHKAEHSPAALQSPTPNPARVSFHSSSQYDINNLFLRTLSDHLA